MFSPLPGELPAMALLSSAWGQFGAIFVLALVPGALALGTPAPVSGVRDRRMVGANHTVALRFRPADRYMWRRCRFCRLSKIGWARLARDALRNWCVHIVLAGYIFQNRTELYTDICRSGRSDLARWWNPRSV